MGCFAKVADEHLGCRGSGQQRKRAEQQRSGGNNQAGGSSEQAGNAQQQRQQAAAGVGTTLTTQFGPGRACRKTGAGNRAPASTRNYLMTIGP